MPKSGKKPMHPCVRVALRRSAEDWGRIVNEAKEKEFIWRHAQKTDALDVAGPHYRPEGSFLPLEQESPD